MNTNNAYAPYRVTHDEDDHTEAFRTYEEAYQYAEETEGLVVISKQTRINGVLSWWIIAELFDGVETFLEDD